MFFVFVYFPWRHSAEVAVVDPALGLVATAGISADVPIVVITKQTLNHDSHNLIPKI